MAYCRGEQQPAKRSVNAVLRPMKFLFVSRSTLRTEGEEPHVRADELEGESAVRPRRARQFV
jgi:hypothetical protein